MARNIHRPKSLFLQNETAVKSHRDLVAKDSFQTALSVALAEYSQSNPSQEELSGVNSFIDLFINLGEKEEDAGAQFPVKRLKEPEEIAAGPEVSSEKKSDKKP